MPAFGSLLRRHRQAAGLTQEELAERARLSARAVIDLERGARLTRGLGIRGDDHLEAAAPQQLDEAGPGRVQTDARHAHARARDQAGRDEPEARGADVTRHVDVDRVQPLGA